MALHLLKLAVGADSLADMAAWVASRAKPRRGKPGEHVHVTRSAPRRAADVLDGGSLYWVIKGQVAARQRILALRAVRGEDGVSRCGVLLEPVLVTVRPRPCKPFQGWRYLEHGDAPPDLGRGLREMPEPLRRELAELGLL